MIHQNHPAAIKMICDSSHVVFNPFNDVCFANVLEDGSIAGGVIFTDFNIVSVQVHVAAFVPSWISTSLLYLTFDYPFNKLGCKKLLGIVPSNNKAALEFDKRVGFEYETTINGVFPNADAIILSMTRDTCRHLGMAKRNFTVMKHALEIGNGQVLR